MVDNKIEWQKAAAEHYRELWQVNYDELPGEQDRRQWVNDRLDLEVQLGECTETLAADIEERLYTLLEDDRRNANAPDPKNLPQLF